MASNYNNPINILDSTNATSLTDGGSMTLGGGISIGKDTFIGGNVSISGTTTAFSDNILLVNNNPTSSTDTGIIFQRYTSDIQNNNNYAGIIYSEQNDSFNLGYLVSDAGRNYVSMGNLVSLNTKEITTGNINMTGDLYKNGSLYNPGSQWITSNSDIYYTTGNVNTSNLITTNISGSNLRLSGDLYVGGTLSTVNVTTTNVMDINITTGTINVTGISNLNNVTATNLSTGTINVSIGITTGTLTATTSISSASIRSTNIIGNSISAGILIGTTITGANMSLSGNLNIAGTLTTVNITSTNLVQTNVSTGTLYASGTSTLQNATATNVSTGTLTASTGITTGTITASTGITTGTITANYIRLDAGTALDFIGNIDAANLTQTYIAFGPAGTSNDSSYLRQLGGTNSYKMALDINDDGDEPGFCIRSVKSTDTPDTINERFTVQAGGNVGINNSSPTANLDVVGTVKVSGLSALANLTATNVSTGTLTASTSLISIGNSNTVGNIYTTGGNVGIGTGSPVEKLEVRGNLRIGNSSQSNYISFHGTSQDGPNAFNHTYIGERLYGGTEASELLLFKGNDSDNGAGPDRIRHLASNHVFATYTSGLSGTFEGVGTSGTTRMTIVSSGNVGIATTSPAYTLDVNGTGLFRNGEGAGGFSRNQLTFGWENTASYMHAIKTRHNAVANNINNAFDFYAWQTSDAPTAVGTKHVMSVTSVGVGIATTSPAYTLDVAGTINASGLSSLTNVTATNVSTGTLTASTSLISIGNSNTVGNIYTTGGNVGIGTTAPSALLDVRGNMNYTGTIVNTSGSFVTQLSGGAKGTYTVQLASDASFFRFYSDLDPTVQSNYPDGRSFDTLISPNSGNHKGYFRGKTATNEFIFKIISYAGFQGAGSAGGNGTYAQTYYNAVSLSGSTVTTQSFGGEVTITIYPINDILSGDILMSNGFVGIGTTSPAYTLDVAGTAKIGGTHSNIIQQYSTSSFPSGSCTKISGNSAASGTTLEIFSGHISVNDRYLLLAKRSTDDYFSIRMDGNVGVGTANPAYTLDVNGTANVSGTAKIGGNNIYNKILTLYDSGVSDAPTGATNFYGFGINSGTLRYQVPSTSTHLFYTGSTGSMIIATSGNVGIATTSPAYTLSVGTTGYGIGSGVYIGDTVVSARWLIQHGNSNLNLLQNNGSGTYLQRGSFANSTGTYSAVSDMRIKKDIQPISSGLNEIANLNPVSYLMEDQTGDSKRNFGFIAQDIESVLPEVVNTPKTENDLYTLQYTSIIPVLTKAIQELTQRLEDLQQEFNNYKASHP